jgi:hypothetical protein
MAGDDPRSPTAPDVPFRAEGLAGWVSDLISRGRRGIGRAADRNRLRLEVRQLQKDRDAFWTRLGKTAYHLVDAGEIDHPALRKAMARIADLDARIGALQTRIAETGDDAP